MMIPLIHGHLNLLCLGILPLALLLLSTLIGWIFRHAKRGVPRAAHVAVRQLKIREAPGRQLRGVRLPDQLLRPIRRPIINTDNLNLP